MSSIHSSPTKHQSSSAMKQCHVCGHEFNKAALPIHQQRCIQIVLKKIKSNSQGNTRDSSAISNNRVSGAPPKSSSTYRPTPSTHKPVFSHQQSKDSFDDMMQRASLFTPKAYVAPAAGPTTFSKRNSVISEQMQKEQSYSSNIPSFEKMSLSNQESGHSYQSSSANYNRNRFSQSIQSSSQSKYEGDHDGREGDGSEEYNQDEEYPDVDNTSRFPCSICNRKFSDLERLEKHKNACVKAQKPRKAFDASKARVKGTELEKYTIPGKLPGKSSKSKTSAEQANKPKSNWRIKHENFVKMVRAARQGGDALAKERVIDTSEYVHCPHCSRNFNQDVAERHLPICQEVTSKSKMRLNGNSYKSPEKDAVYKKRMGYRPPPPKANGNSSKSASSSPQKTNPTTTVNSPVKSSPLKGFQR